MYNKKDYDEKDDRYYRHSRKEMLDFVPANVKALLDVGCADGSFGKLVKEKLNCTVWGIEPDAVSAGKASEKLDKAYCGLFDNKTDLQGQKFDCIVFNDVLEHLADPYAMLQLCKKHLNSYGTIVSSIPNVRYFYTFKNVLFKKDWLYENAGVMDKTHLRFFTSKSIVRMFKEEGYEVIAHKGINPWAPRSFRFLNFILFNFIDDMRYPQYATVARVITE